MKQLIVVALVLLVASIATATAEDAPSMWMEQNGDTIDLMVNISESSSGANAWVYFDPTAMDITNVDLSSSPWTPMTQPGWSHQGDHIVIALTNFDGVAAGEYKIATMDATCKATGESTVTITNAEPIGVTVYPLTYMCSDPTPDADAVIAIGDATGTTSIPITITNAVDVGACDITLTYDPTVVKVTGVTDGDMDCTFTNLEHTGDGWIRLGTVQGSSDGISGSLSVLHVDLEPVSEGATCPLTLSVTTYKDATPAGTAMTYTISSGTYTSPAPVINGDANDDGTVDMVDASYIANHVIGIAGYEQIDEDVANVNGDSVLDMADSMYLTKHILAIAGFETLQ